MNKLELFDFLLLHGFELNTQFKSKFFGDDCDIFKSETVAFRFSKDRGIAAVDVRSMQDNDSEGWFDLASVRDLLNQKANLNHVTTISDLTIFIENDLSKIRTLFSPQNYPSTKKKLEELQRKRARQMFPEQDF